LDYVAGSDALVDAAWALGIGSLVATAAMFAALFALHWTQAGFFARRRRRAEQWRMRLLDAVSGDATIVAADVPRRERRAFLQAWTGLRNVLRGDCTLTLDRLLVSTGLDAVCRYWLRLPRPVERRVLAAVALGHFGAPDDWPRLLPLLHARQTWLAVTAMTGLMRIDAARATGAVLARLGQMPGWPRDIVRAAFHAAGPDAVTAPLLAWLPTASPEALAHWLPLLDTAEAGAAQAALVPLLDAQLSMEPLAAVLRLVDTPHALPAVRALARHPEWEVRTQVANALGRIGEDEDRERLRELLGDPYWWVRQRAAQSLARLPGADPATLQAMLGGLTDRYAEAALREAVAERWLPSVAQA
jgi:hypothetical protein